MVGRALLLEEDVNDPRHAASLAKLRVAAERCGRIVKTFLAMARAKPQQRRPVSANRLIDAALDLAGYGLRSAGVEVERDFEPDLPPVSADEDQLHQVFLNLLLNAQQALRDAPQPRRILLAKLRGRPGARSGCRHRPRHPARPALTGVRALLPPAHRGRDRDRALVLPCR